ncbi:twin-arginine translocation signal domain-containing protein, partial [Vibrio parahaemolyticus]
MTQSHTRSLSRRSLLVGTGAVAAAAAFPKAFAQAKIKPAADTALIV